MSEQLAVRLPDEDAAALEALVRRGRFPSKAAAVRGAVQALIEWERRREVGQAIVDGYRRSPQTDEEVARARHAALVSIAEEPW